MKMMKTTFALTPDAAFKVDRESRTIRGLALPFKVQPRDGRGIQFLPGSLQFGEMKRVKVFNNHNYDRPVGYLAEYDETEEAASVATKIGRGSAGDEVLLQAEDGVLDGFSVGVNIIEYEVAEDGSLIVSKAELFEISLTAMPAFDDARITSVKAAMEQPEEEAIMDEAKIAEIVSKAVDAKFASVPAREEQPVVPAAIQVKESAPYRFDGKTGGEYEFSTDMFSAIRGDSAAKIRLDKFVAETFANVGEADVDDLNPVTTRADLYVDYIEKDSPVAGSIGVQPLSKITPFYVPKFGSAAGLVADHVAGTDPTEGSFTTTNVLIEPKSVSGLIKLDREVVDQGGNPNVSQLIWRQMNRAYAEKVEVDAAAVINAATIAELGTAIAAGATGSAAAAGALAALQAAVFVDGSTSWDFGLGHRDLWLALVGEEDLDGRPLYPVNSPSNANGSAGQRFRSLDIAGYRFVPAGSLGATNVGQKSYVGNKDAVFLGASAPKQINWETVATMNVGLFGYFGGAVTNASAIRKITYDTTA